MSGTDSDADKSRASRSGGSRKERRPPRDYDRDRPRHEHRDRRGDRDRRRDDRRDDRPPQRPSGPAGGPPPAPGGATAPFPPLTESQIARVAMELEAFPTQAAEDPLRRSDPWRAGPAGTATPGAGPAPGAPAAAAAEGPPAAPGSVEAIHQALYKQLTEHVDSTMAEFKRATAITVATAIHAEQAAMATRIDASESEIAQIKQKINEAEAEQARHKEAIETIQKALAIAEARTAVPDIIAESDFDRPPDPAVFSVGAPDLVAPQLVQQALLGWFRDAGVDPATATLQGDVPAKRFTLRLLGGAAVVSPRAVALARALRLAGGSWRQFSSTSVAGQTVPLYVSTDRSPRQIRREIQTRRLHQLLKEAKQDTDFRPFKQKGRISAVGVPLVRLEVGSAANIDTKIIWNYAQSTKLHIDSAAIERAFNDFFAEDRGVSWG